MKKYKHIIGLCMGVILLCICLGIGFSTDMFDSFEDVAEGMTADGTTFLKAAVAIFILVIVSNFFQLFVNLLKKGDGRALTMASVISSLVKYGRYQ